MSEYQNNSIFWVETTKIKPNPFQPRREFEPKALEDLADSIRQYGVLQPLVVTRKETLRPDDHGMDVHYELIAGERRLRASRIAGLAQVPIIIRKETDDKVKLELAIIENLQREDLNPIDRALAFEKLYKQFNLTHVEIGKRMGKSRVYVSNSIRLLSLPEEIKQGLMAGKITEGHTRPLLMLIDRPQEQTTLYKEIMVKKMSVRDAEKVARNIAQDRVRKKEFIIDPRIRDFEKKLSENLGTRVQIEPKENGGQITIDYFTLNDLEEILKSMRKVEREKNMMERYIADTPRIKREINQESFKNMNVLAHATGININALNAESRVQKQQVESLMIQGTRSQQLLPAYQKIENTDIQEYHNEIAAPVIKDYENILESTHQQGYAPNEKTNYSQKESFNYLESNHGTSYQKQDIQSEMDLVRESGRNTYESPKISSVENNFQDNKEYEKLQEQPIIQENTFDSTMYPNASSQYNNDSFHRRVIENEGSNQKSLHTNPQNREYEQQQHDSYQPSYSQTRYLDQNTHDFDRTNRQQPYQQNQNQNQTQNYYQPPPKKKTFFGKLFS
jgi:ParB family chromosome partitioning protein